MESISSKVNARKRLIEAYWKLGIHQIVVKVVGDACENYEAEECQDLGRVKDGLADHILQRETMEQQS